MVVELGRKGRHEAVLDATGSVVNGGYDCERQPGADQAIPSHGQGRPIADAQRALNDTVPLESSLQAD